MLSSKTNSSDYLSLCTYSISHFIVDFSCAFLVFRLCALNMIPIDRVFFVCSVYNSLAFGIEFLIGVFFNEKTSRLSSILGGLILFGALQLAAGVSESVVVGENASCVNNPLCYALGLANQVNKWDFYSLLACSLAGIGNAFFHIGGGVDTLVRNYGKYWQSGVYISTGSLGLALGGHYGTTLNSGIISFELTSLTLCVCLVCIWICCRFNASLQSLGSDVEMKTYIAENGLPLVKKGKSSERRFSRHFWIVGALLFVIFSRSVVSFLAPQVWGVKTTLTFSGFTLAFAAFLGKFVGGFCADLIEPRLFGFIAIAFSIPFLCFCLSPIMFWTGVLLLNMSTAVTLTAIAQNCGKQIGFAFGLTTLALLAGFFVYNWLGGALERYDCVEKTTQILVGSLVASAIAIFFSAKRVCLEVENNDSQ